MGIAAVGDQDDSVFQSGIDHGSCISLTTRDLGRARQTDCSRFRPWPGYAVAALVAEAMGLGTVEPVVPHRVHLLTE